MELAINALLEQPPFKEPQAVPLVELEAMWPKTATTAHYALQAISLPHLTPLHVSNALLALHLMREVQAALIALPEWLFFPRTTVRNALQGHSLAQTIPSPVNNVPVEHTLMLVLPFALHALLEARLLTAAQAVWFALLEALFFPLTTVLNALKELSPNQRTLPHVLHVPLVLTP